MLTSLLKMIIAHLIGDFVLQPKSWVERRKTNIFYLIYHVLIHAGLLIVFFINDLASNWQNILFLTASHLAIDSLKIGLETRWPANPIRWFLMDQFLHLLCIFAVFFYQDIDLFSKLWSNINWNSVLLYSIAILLLVFVIPILIRIFFSRWNTQNEFASKGIDTLLDAGTLIGIIERLLILCFVMLNFMEGVGFLLAAKSIFRFGDLSNARDTKFTEYVLIGTLLSFGLGIMISLALKHFLTTFY